MHARGGRDLARLQGLPLDRSGAAGGPHGRLRSCISATANLNADLCGLGRRRYRRARRRRNHPQLFDGKQLRVRREGLTRAHSRRSGLGARRAAAQCLRSRRPHGGDGRLRRRASAGGTRARAQPSDLGVGRRPSGLHPGFDSPGRGDYKLAALAARFRRLSLLEATPDDIPAAGRPRTRIRMANTSSARKATRVIARRTAINKARRSRLRNTVRTVEEAIASGDREKAIEALEVAEPMIQRSAQRGIVHRNAADRKVSRLTKRVAQLGKSSPARRLSRAAGSLPGFSRLDELKSRGNRIIVCGQRDCLVFPDLRVANV